MSAFTIPNKLPEALKFDVKSLKEEIANQISHGIGLIAAISITPFLLYLANQSTIPKAFLSTAVYCFSLILVYTSSTLYHSAYTLKLRRNLRIFDHISIYFLIAGSYTPYILMYVKTTEGYIILGALWILTIIGSIFKLFFTHKFKLVSTLAYAVMGWQAIFIYKTLAIVLPPESLLWIKIGGAFYTGGIVFYLWKKLKQNHLIWHLFVLAGSTSHVISVYYLLQ